MKKLIDIIKEDFMLKKKGKITKTHNNMGEIVDTIEYFHSGFDIDVAGCECHIKKKNGSEDLNEIGKLLKDKIYFNKKKELSNNDHIRINIDEVNKIILVDDTCESVETTIKKWQKLFEKGWNIQFTADISLQIRTGKSHEQKDWPYIDEDGWVDIIRHLSEENDNIKFNLELNRFKCENVSMPVEPFKLLNIEKVYLSECKFETSLDLTDLVDAKRKYKLKSNHILTFTTDSKRAQKYYDETINK